MLSKTDDHQHVKMAAQPDKLCEEQLKLQSEAMEPIHNSMLKLITTCVLGSPLATHNKANTLMAFYCVYGDVIAAR